jgi:signal transduction histidine kinase
VLPERAEVLIVDDLHENLIALEALIRREDLIVYRASSGAEALELVLDHDFALAFVDVQMPVMNGFELAELIRGTDRSRHVPIVFVSAGAKEHNYAFKGYETGAVDFLQKPLDTHAVKSKVNVFLELYRQRQTLKRQLETVQRIQAEQQSLLAELRETQGQLEAAVRVRDDFMSMASHELKTPLTSLRLQSQMRMRHLANSRVELFTPESLERMVKADIEQIDGMVRLIDDMLDVSRVRSGKLTLQPTRYDVVEHVREIVSRMTDLLDSAGCRLELTGVDSAMVTWDRFRIEQVVMNLLTNAMRYGAKAPVVIDISTGPYEVEIRVRDHGIGIDAQNIARIFQPFERVDGNGPMGLGLGLYIVSRIVEAHGGRIEVESQTGAGSTFTVSLPFESFTADASMATTPAVSSLR